MRELTQRIRDAVLARTRDDSGVALVAAVAVAIIGLALAMVVVTQALVVTNDSQRDRVRTTEVHSAEGVLDSAIAKLRTALSCEPWTTTVGEGTTAVEVTVEYFYYDEDGPLTSCVGDTIQGKPTGVEIRATGVPVEPLASGITPERTIAAGVELAPGVTVRYQAAIFASGVLETRNQTDVTSADPAQVPSVRVEGSGVNYTCDAGIDVRGDLVVVQGSAVFQHSNCRVRGDVWVRDNFQVKAPHGDGKANIMGDVTVYTGNMDFTNGNYKIGGDVKVKGNVTGYNSATATAKSWCAANKTPCTSAQLGAAEQVIGLPVIDWTPSAWTSEGFAIRTRDNFNAEYIRQANAVETWKKQQITGDCVVADWKWWASGPKVFKFNQIDGKDEVWDLRTCKPFQTQGMTFELYGDVAIYANSFSVNGQTTYKSGDGQPHTLYILVPNGGPATNESAVCGPRGSYTPGDINFHTSLRIEAPVDVFLYSPCKVQYSNPSLTRGQVYGKDITIHTNNGFEFVPVNVPGRLDPSTSVTPTEYKVGVRYKQELRNS